MSLPFVTPRAVSRLTLSRIIAIRSRHTIAHPDPAKIQLKLPEKGFFKYDRDWSRDKRYSEPQKPGDTPDRFLFRKLDHAYELYPLLGLLVFWSGLFAYTVHYSFSKVEIWLDKSKDKKAPSDWERIRDSYYKKPTLLIDRRDAVCSQGTWNEINNSAAVHETSNLASF